MVHGKQAGQSEVTWEQVPEELAFRTSREHITRLIEAHPQLWDQTVPACPEWTVRDLLAHVVRHCRSSRDAWPSRPIEELTTAELLEEWARTGPEAEARIAADRPGTNALFVMDTFTHELDLRRVVGEQMPLDHPALPISMGVLLGGFSYSVQGHGAPPVRIETEGAQWTAGRGPAAATLRAHPLDLYRSLAGRRSHQQIAELSWSAPARPWLPAFTWGPFHPPAQPTEELVGVDAAYR